MFHVHARELIKELLESIAQVGKIPIAVYEHDEQRKPRLIVTANAEHLPERCHQLLGRPESAALCNADMARRATEGLDSQSSCSSACHAGLWTEVHPIVLHGETVAVMHFGGFAESASPEADRDLLWMKQLLPLFISRLVHRQTVESHQEEGVRKYEEASRRLAYHDVQLRLQSALAQAENHLEDVKDPAVKSWMLENSAEELLKTIELAGTVLQNLMQGEYLPDEYEFRQHNLRDIILSAVTLARPMAARRTILIKVEITPDNLPILLPASYIHLQQAFNNLIHNAVKYSYRGSEFRPGEVFIRGFYMDHGYKIIIENSGIGILEEEYEKIFESGYKGKLRQRERQTGSGLGLPLTREIIEKHRGKISVVSEPLKFTAEHGGVPYLTKFSVWLPLTQPAGKEPTLRLVKGENHG